MLKTHVISKKYEDSQNMISIKNGGSIYLFFKNYLFD